MRERAVEAPRRDVRPTGHGATSRAEVFAACKKLISQYHPDEVAQMGEEIRAVAEAKTQDINAAYEIGMRLFRT
ncbi:MAG: hypothetical protein U1F11_12315 [Steroidobacteraceae bacterium]